MSSTNNVPKLLFSNFINSLGIEMIALATHLNEPLDKEGFHLIDRGYLFDFSVLEPRKKITKKQYYELLIIYSLCWMTECLDSHSNSKSQNVDQAILGTVLFYAYLMGHEPSVDEEDFDLHRKRILKILNAYENTDIVQYVKVVAEYEVKGETKAGLTVTRLLNYFMEFKVLS